MAFSIIYYKTYLEYDQVIGAANMQLKWKEHILDLDKLVYCKSLDCVMWDKHQAGISIGEKSFLIVTRVKEVLEVRNCSTDSRKCKVPGIWEEKSKKITFVAGVEESVLHIDHSFIAPLFHDEDRTSASFTNDNSNMTGVVMKKVGSSSKVLLEVGGAEHDIIPIPTLLEAANIASLQDFHGDQMLREQGMHLYLDISYNNARCNRDWSCAFGTVHPSYRYRVNMVPQQGELTSIVDNEDGTRKRTVLHGIMIHVVQSGKIGRFSMSSLMTQVSTALGMLVLSTSVVDFLATYWLPNHTRFGILKYPMRKLVEEKQKKQ